MPDIDNADRFSKIASGVQSIVVTLAVIIGGGWTLYSFNATRTAEKAALDIELAKARKPQIEVAMEAKAQSSYDPGDTTGLKQNYLRVIVTLKNAGNTKFNVDLSEKTLFIAEVNIVDGQLVADEILSRISHLTTLSYKHLTLPAGNSIQLPYLLNIKSPGLYFIEFRLPWPNPSGFEEIPGVITMAGSDLKQHYTVASAFIDITDITIDSIPNSSNPAIQQKVTTGG